MFSSSEGGWTRHTHLFVAGAEGGVELEVDLPADLEDSEQRLRALPSDARLEQFARRLSAALATEYPRHAGVGIELWRTHFDRVDLTPRTELMRDYRHPQIYLGDIGAILGDGWKYTSTTKIDYALWKQTVVWEDADACVAAVHGRPNASLHDVSPAAAESAI